jgi:hypothetical protein
VALPRLVILGLLFVVLLGGAALAQQASVLPANPPQGGNLAGPFNPLATMQFWL